MASMRTRNIQQLVFAAYLFGLYLVILAMSTMNVAVKLVYCTAVGLILHTFYYMRILSIHVPVILTAVCVPVLHANKELMIAIVVGMYCLFTFTAVLSVFPAEYVLACGTAILAVMYTSIITAAIIQFGDSWANAAYMGAMFLVWYGWMSARPAF